MVLFRTKMYHSQAKVSNNSADGNEEYDMVVLRNLRPETDTEEIFDQLRSHGYKVLNIRNAVNNLTQRAVPLFFIKLERRPWNMNIMKLNRLAGQVVSVEKYRPNPEIPRCTICQDLGHMSAECKNPPVCAWCSGPHATCKCTIGKDVPPKCSRCGGMHPSNYKGCQVYRQWVLEARREMYNRSSTDSSTTSEILSSEDYFESSTSPGNCFESSTSPGNCFESSTSPGNSSGKSEYDFSELNIIWKTDSEYLKMCPDCLRQLLGVKMEHYLSFNKDLRAKLF